VSEVVPAALAVAGTALMVVAFFGPFRRHAIEADGEAGVLIGPGHNGAVAWPALVEASAAAIDVAARIELADALGALQSAWSESILRKAYETEPDPGVRSAIEAALSSSQSLVT
jgi:hypothetical protein